MSTCAHELNLSSLYISDDSTAKISTKKHFVIHIERNIDQIRGRGSLKIWPRQRLRGPEFEIYFYSMCAQPSKSLLSSNCFKCDFRAKIMWKIKCFGPLWAPVPCINVEQNCATTGCLSLSQFCALNNSVTFYWTTADA